MINNVFLSMYRVELAHTLPDVSIDYYTRFMEKHTGSTDNCAKDIILKTVLLMIAEQVQQKLVKKIMTLDRKDEDLIDFHKSTIINKMFSFRLYQHFTCPRGHKYQVMATSVGLRLKKSKKN